jgi:serine/threonine protein kinase
MLYDVLADSQHNIDLLMQEVSIAWKIHHPNIASVCGVTIELKERRKTAWIIMELLQGSMAGLIDESRREGVRQLTLREKVDMAHDSLCGLNHLHCLVSIYHAFLDIAIHVYHAVGY